MAKKKSQPAGDPSAVRIRPEPPKRRRGQPTKYSTELGLQICERIAAGALLKDAAAHFKLPAETVCRWAVRHPEFRQAYAQSREDRTAIWAEQMLEVARDGSRDYDKDGRLNKEHVLRSKLIVETMQWQMARLDPRLWAEKRHIDANVQTSVADMSEEQREAMVQQLLKRLEIIARPALEERKRLEAQRKTIDVTPKAEPASAVFGKQSEIEE